MNRIIIAGNGFDLAHDLKTKYEDFINWYWENTFKKLQECFKLVFNDGLCRIELERTGYLLYNYFRITLLPSEIYKYLVSLRERYNGIRILEVSPFLSRISQSIETKGWVDIEADYYAMLVERKGKKDELERLNKDFAVIQKLLIEYLNEIQQKEVYEELINDDIKRHILAPFKQEEVAVSSDKVWKQFIDIRTSFTRDEWSRLAEDYFGSGFENLFLYEVNKYNDKIKKSGLDSIEEINKNVLLPDRTMLLNFNYTTTADLYMPGSSRFIVNHIHGELDPKKLNNVIFGYGDESDDEYENLKKMNDNEYLRHIKTSRYLETTKYRDLLSFIESGPFQVVIMGHSCGLSDRTMLNTLFEHENCVSIKPYYYVNEQGKDNYLDIVQNISRNFTNPKLMRDRVVNKTFCEPLPQVSKE